MDRKQLSIIKNKLIKERLQLVSHQVKSEQTLDPATIAEVEKRWCSLFDNRIQSHYVRFVNLHDFVPESIFLSRYYPLIAHLGEWKCNKTRSIAKAKQNPFQITTSFEIRTTELADALFPTLSLFRSHTLANGATLFYFFDLIDEPLKLTYNWTTQELAVSFCYRLFQRRTDELTNEVVLSEL